MPDQNHITPQEQSALIRYSAVSHIQQQQSQGHTLAEAIRDAASRPWPDGHTGKHYAVRTLEDWWYAYQKGGFKSLTKSTKKGITTKRSLTKAQQAWLIEQRENHPQIPIKVAYQRWLHQDQGKDLPSLTTIYRFLRDRGLHRQSLTQLDAFHGPSKAFEAPFPNDLWMTDFSPGPKLTNGQGQVITTHLAIIIDDHSRLITYAAYYPSENTQSFHHALKQAILRRGVPHKLYADNGAPFVSKHTHIVCANLGIRLLHHKPYHAWSKGKAERVIYSIQLGFETLLSLPEERAHSIEDLNTKLSIWIQREYHIRKHSSTGTSPQSRFQDGSEHLRQLELSHQALDKLFYTRMERTVRKNGTIRILNQIYEVSLSLRGRRIELRYDPFQSKPTLEVYHKGHYQGTAHLADLHLNSQFDHQNYERH
jgi:putative transposase